MIQFTFKKPPRSAIAFYLIGFLIIIPTVLHQFLYWNFMSVATNQRLFIIGAIVVCIGSVLNWVVPIVHRHKNINKESD